MSPISLAGTTFRVSLQVSAQQLESGCPSGYHTTESGADEGARDTSSLDWPSGDSTLASPHLLPSLTSHSH